MVTASDASSQRQHAAVSASSGSAATITKRIFLQLEERGSTSKQATGAGGRTTYAALQKADAAWLDIRTRMQQGPRPTFVTESDQLLGMTELDVLVCGGTLGIFLAAALQVWNCLQPAIWEDDVMLHCAQERSLNFLSKCASGCWSPSHSCGGRRIAGQEPGLEHLA